MGKDIIRESERLPDLRDEAQCPLVVARPRQGLIAAAKVKGPSVPLIDSI